MKQTKLTFVPAILPVILPLVLLTGCNSLKWNSDILGGAATGADQAAAIDPGAPLSAIPTDESIAQAGLVEDPAAVSSSTLPSNSGAPVAGFQGRATTVASLGDPAIGGMWMETSLVTTEQQAKLRSSSGQEVTVTLKPAAAEGSGRLSIAAMRALEAPLTELVEVEVLPAG
ncbi:hypothetical protein [Pseudophaeobacter sp.]|uniref:hypothetical protein n=1 Tax=Pseudophaeobacter sp. TaxID=1971739 RepID=UPI003297E1E3